jgi:hypothetical protein
MSVVRNRAGVVEIISGVRDDLAESNRAGAPCL